MKCKDCRGFGEVVRTSAYMGSYRFKCQSCDGTGKAPLNWCCLGAIALIVAIWGLVLWLVL